MRLARIRFVLFALLLSLILQGSYAMESLSGLTILMDVYTYNPENLQIKKVARTNIMETMENYKPESEYWFVRPYKNPAIAYTQPEFRALVVWLKREGVTGLVLDDHEELSDEDINRLRTLPKLTLLSLRKTGISDRSMAMVAKLEKLRYLDISRTQVTDKGLAHLKASKLEKIAFEDSKIAPEEFDAFQTQRKIKLGLMPKDWSSVWDATRSPDPVTTTSFFAGSTPDEEIPGFLPKGKFKADYNLILKPLKGEPVNLLTQKGKVVFINFWTTTCTACKSELPRLEGLYQTMRDKNVFFAYVSPESPLDVQASVDQQPRNLPIYTVDEASIAKYVTGGLPATIVFSKKGDWVVHRFNPAQWDSHEIVTYLNKLIYDSK